MGGFKDWFAGFDLGEFLGIGLSTAEIGHLAGSLFLALFGLSAILRVRQATGVLAIVWITVAIALFAGAFLIAARGFPEQVPEPLKPFTEPERLTRAAAALAMLGCSFVLLSAHWTRRPLARLAFRLAGLAMAGLAVWLAAAWFGDQVPEDVRPWTAQDAIARIVVLLGLIVLAGTFWVRRSEEPHHARWFSRALTPPALAIAVLLAVKWFGPHVPPEVPLGEVRSVTAIVAAIATGTCLLIAAGAYLLRNRSGVTRARSLPQPPDIPNEAYAEGPLPVAIALDEYGRPILPLATPRPRHPGR
jgi:hypothetical protein